MMKITQFLYFLALANLLFRIIWWACSFPIAFLLVLQPPKAAKIAAYTVRAFGSFLLVTLTALVTLGALRDNPSGLALIFYPLIAAFVLFLGYAQNYREVLIAAKQITDSGTSHGVNQDARFEAVLMMSAIVLFGVTLFVPDIARNVFTQLLFRAMYWVGHLPVIGSLIGWVAGLFLLSMAFYGLLAIGFITVTIVSQFRKSPKAARETVD